MLCVRKIPPIPSFKKSRSNRADNRALGHSGLAQSARDGNLQLPKASTGLPNRSFKAFKLNIQAGQAVSVSVRRTKSSFLISHLDYELHRHVL